MLWRWCALVGCGAVFGWAVLAGCVGSASAAVGGVNARVSWVANGAVMSVLPVGPRVYVGGNFTYLGPLTGPGVVLNRRTGSPTARFPTVDDVVVAAVADGAGGYFISGDFHHVGGVSRSGLAHIRSDGTVDRLWKARTDGRVFALARLGSTLFVGGAFTRVDGEPRANLAALDARTGRLGSWDPGVRPSGSGTVWTLAASGSTLFVGGSFSQVGGQPRNGLASVDALTGAVTSWDPYVTTGWAFVGVLAVAGSTVYVGGLTAPEPGVPDVASVTAFDSRARGTLLWTTALTNRSGLSVGAYALAVSGSRVYVGGLFDHVGSQSRNALAALNRNTGSLASWDPRLSSLVATTDPPVQALAIYGSTIYVGGLFNQIGGRSRTNLAAISTRTGSASSWISGADGIVSAMAVSPSSLYAGGSFESAGGREHDYLAVLDPSTRAFTPGPPVNGNVDAIVRSGASVYLGGAFTRVGGGVHKGLAALSAATGAVTAWSANADGAVQSLAVGGPWIYAGGVFGRIGHVTRRDLAAVTASSGAVTRWNPGANGAVNAIAVSGERVYIGGQFTRIGARIHKWVAALDGSRGAVIGAFNPRPAFSVDCGQRDPPRGCGGGPPGVMSLAVYRSIVYVGGVFSAMGGRQRWYLAAVSSTDGHATSWNPNQGGVSDEPYGVTYALYASPWTLWAGTDQGVAAFSLPSGTAIDWQAEISSARALAIANGQAYVGGDLPNGTHTLSIFDLPGTVS